MKIEFIAFRHGETDWNKERRFQGHSNIDLNATGIAQAEELAQKLSKFKIPLIVSSDLQRALRTAEIVSRVHSAKIITSERLREAHLGETEGVLLDDVLARFGEESFRRWMSSHSGDLDFAWPGGESKRDLLARIREFLKKFTADHVMVGDSLVTRGNPVANTHPIGISTHGGILANLVAHSKNAPAEIRVPNCGAYWLEYDAVAGTWTFLGQI